MSLSHLLDTSVYCQPIKPMPLTSVRNRWTRLGDDVLAISVICDAEILYGLELKQSQRLTGLYESLLKGRLRVLPIDSGIARDFAVLKSDARRNGLSPSDFDLLIAATARAHNLTLATLNMRHFRGLGISVEDWSEPKS